MKFKIIFALIVIFILPLFLVVAAWIATPDVSKLDQCFTTSLYEVKVCPGSSSYVRVQNVSHMAKRAIIVSEDGTFYSHDGFDWFELKQSFLKNLKSFEYQRGGSTITQQLAKNAFLSKEKTIFRKLTEAYTANLIEKKFSKDLIFEKYLNMVEFGPSIFGIKSASQRYFHKPPSRIHLLEAVWLAHLLPNPKVYSRGIQKGVLSEYSEKRVRILLQRLLKYGDIDKAQFEFASSQVQNFPWRELTIESFEISNFDSSEQDKAIEELMQNDDWVTEEEEQQIVEPPSDSEEF